MLAYGDGKSLSNVGECFTISIATVVAVGVRVAVGRHLHPQIWPVCLVIVLIIVAIATYVLTSSLPE